MNDIIYQVEDLSFTYPSGNQVLRSICLTLKQGEVLTILGPNGAGKSTLLNCMSGLVKPTGGKVLLGGKDIRTMHIRDVARMVGYVQQTHVPVFAYPVLHYVVMGRAAGIGMMSKPKPADTEAGMQALRDLHIEYLAQKPYTELSGGERQQVTIARVLAQAPQAILFDEPTAHLDYGNQLRILQLIKDMSARGFSIIITTHNPDHALLLGGHAAIVDKSGEILYGDSRSILTESRLSAIYRTSLRLVDVPELERTACLSPGLH